jgi:predicted nucleotide-binding protein
MELLEIIVDLANKLEEIGNEHKNDDFDKPLQLLREQAINIGKSWCGSWLGYHSKVYYKRFIEPPPGAHFSKEWGLMETLAIQDTQGDWQEYGYEEVISAIYKRSGNPDINSQETSSAMVKEAFNEYKEQARSAVINLLKANAGDKYIQEILEKISKLINFSDRDFIEAIKPSGQFISRDMVAIQAGLQTPPHISIIARVATIEYPYKLSEDLAKLLRRVVSHLANAEMVNTRGERPGSNIFIGHGRSTLWKDLKEFIQDRLELPWDEFNRVPVAGITNINRLSEMLAEAAIAFLILTAEDEQKDGSQRARQNVIHEAGLFQGRLGFEKAIILLEEGCEDFSNIQGLGHIRFPKGNISAAFEDIRKVLEREKLVKE